MSGSIRNPSGFSNSGTGMSIQRMCAMCHNPRTALGSGMVGVAVVLLVGARDGQAGAARGRASIFAACVGFEGFDG